jgi:hypothetical protein
MTTTTTTTATKQTHDRHHDHNTTTTATATATATTTMPTTTATTTATYHDYDQTPNTTTHNTQRPPHTPSRRQNADTETHGPHARHKRLVRPKESDGTPQQRQWLSKQENKNSDIRTKKNAQQVRTTRVCAGTTKTGRHLDDAEPSQRLLDRYHILLKRLKLRHRWTKHLRGRVEKRVILREHYFRKRLDVSRRLSATCRRRRCLGVGDSR